MITRVARRAAVAVALTSLVAAPAVAAELIGTAGDDHLVGTDGADTISGADGADELLGRAGADAVRGGSGPDVLHGDAGNDRLKGDKGADRLFGGTEDDTFLGGAGDDVLVGEAGDDVLIGEDGSDVLRGAAGFDELRPDGTDRTFGGPDADTFEVSSGAPVSRGGDGNDTYVGAGDGRQQFFGGLGDDYAETQMSLSGLATLDGGPGDDYLLGWASLDGGDGADTLWSQAAGAEVTVSGGDGDDTLFVEQPFDPTESGASCGPGTDTITLDLGDVVPDDCETVGYNIWGTDGADQIDGTPYADFVVPFDGADTIRTYGGDDFVNGGNDTGPDVYWFGAGDDSVRARDGIVDTIHCGPGHDRVTADEIDVVADDCEFLGDFDF